MPAKYPYFNKRYVIYLLVIALLLYAVLPQLNAFKRSISLLEHVNVSWLLLAVVVSLVAHIVSGFKYVSLALKPLRVFATVLVQLASLLVNRLVPAGIGGIGINYLYLSKFKHNKVQSAVVVSMNNLVGFVGHMALVALVLLVAPTTSFNFHLSSYIVVIATLLVFIIGLGAYTFRKRFTKLLAQLLTSLRIYRRHPLKIVWAVFWSMVIAASYAACLWYSAKALGLQLNFLQALVVLTLGIAATSISPTPGGLIGVEAALVAGLVAYNSSASQALAVALLYRLITYWFALLLGAFAFVACRRAKYF
ncbi:MAG TPA: lysylphosphatidylglycerol synthase transmembrane domain-containing protein [Candidatus Saccharimonadales bacterium]|nr:lysylphosphatidylglycerol synthase transmembrane domain-containing protein [Candidatus Saccharimonadales bacterium]